MTNALACAEAIQFFEFLLVSYDTEPPNISLLQQ